MKKMNFLLTALAVMMMLFVGCPNETMNSGTTDTTIKQDTEQNGTTAQHTIAYCNLNDNGTAVMSVYAENEKVVLQDIPRTGYSFRGWFDGTDDTAQKVTGWEAGTHTDNVVLWAKWDPITVMVTLQNGSETATITGTYGDYLPNVTVPTKAGSIFAGYYTEENRSGVRYIDQEGQGYRIFKSTAAMTLYAGWAEISSGDGNSVTNVISVAWKGSLDTAPTSPETGWAYYNIADKKSYIYDGAEWQIIAQNGSDGNDGKDGENGKDADVWTIGEDGYWYLNGNKTEYHSKGADGTNGTNGADGISIVWKGNFTAAPDSPQTGWAYYNAVDKKSYIYNGTEWNILAQDGANGGDGQSSNTTINVCVTWKGSSETAPTNAQAGWAYYNTAEKKSYIYDGSAWNILAQDGVDGQNGLDGVDGQDADVWTIEDDGYWYLNGEKTEYMSKGADGQNGTNGTNGTSIVWKGSLSSAPSNPQTCWAYYNTTDKKSYIYNGTSWDILAQDGVDGQDVQDGQDGKDATSDSNFAGYKVVFYANGGVGTMANMICQFDTEYTLPECGFTAPTGYKFNGWDKGSVGTTFTNLAVNAGDVVVVGARWIMRTEYNIIYHNMEGASTDSPRVYSVNNSVTLLDAAKVGWYFLGWYDNANLTGNPIISWDSGDYIADVELWAKWVQLIEYNIVYHNMEGATTDSPTVYTIYSSIRLLNAKKAGWCFVGWYDNANLTGNPITGWDSGDYIDDVELWAKWIDVSDLINEVDCVVGTMTNWCFESNLVNGVFTYDLSDATENVDAIFKFVICSEGWNYQWGSNYEEATLDNALSMELIKEYESVVGSGNVGLFSYTFTAGHIYQIIWTVRDGTGYVKIVQQE